MDATVGLLKRKSTRAGLMRAEVALCPTISCFHLHHSSSLREADFQNIDYDFFELTKDAAGTEIYQISGRLARLSTSAVISFSLITYCFADGVEFA